MAQAYHSEGISESDTFSDRYHILQNQGHMVQKLQF